MKSITRRITLFALPVLLAAGGYFGYRYSSTVAPEQRYKLQVIEAGKVVQSVSANGTLNPVSLVNVGTQVSGTVKRLHVDFNDKVEAGQVLAELDDALFSAQARQSAANVLSATATLDLASANETRMRTLLAQEYVSRQEFDQAEQARKTATAQLALARAQADKDRASLSYTVIRSPVSGVVVARNVDVGQTVAASFQTPTFFQIAKDLGSMQIDTSFPEADIGNIKVGQAVRFNVDAYPNRSFKGVVRQIRLNPNIQQNVVTYDVVITVDNRELVLLPGMTAYVNIAVAQKDEVLLVPNAALRFKPPEGAVEVKATVDKPDEKGTEAKPAKRRKDAASGTVHVLRDDKLVPVSIVTGITDNRQTEVASGELQAGDKVVTGENVVATPATSKSIGMRMF